MSRITHISFNTKSRRFWIYVDGEYCTSVRERTFPALGIVEGQEITCEEVKDLEKFHWKHKYGEKAWKKEKRRIRKVKELIEARFPRIAVRTVGFGAESNEFIADHPEEPGKPDLLVAGRDSGEEYCMVEVTGTETMRGSTYWVRPDKIEYANQHPDEDVWICLHFNKPSEKFVFIKPNPTKDYAVTQMKIRGSTEYYIEFSDSSDEVFSAEDFLQHLVEKRQQFGYR